MREAADAVDTVAADGGAYFDRSSPFQVRPLMSCDSVEPPQLRRINSVAEYAGGSAAAEVGIIGRIRRRRKGKAWDSIILWKIILGWREN